MRSVPTAASLPFSDGGDEDLLARSDYFVMVGAALLDDHSPASWRAFRCGYTVMTAFYRENVIDAPIAPPLRRNVRAVA